VTNIAKNGRSIKEKISSFSEHLNYCATLIQVVVFGAVMLTGCDFNRIPKSNLEKQTSGFYEIYFNGGRDDARRSIQEANRLIEEAKLAEQQREGQAFALFIGYARLYSLERKSHNDDMAQLDLIKARYWALRSEELHGDTPAECNAYVAKFASDDNLVTFIDKWDRDANNGKSPKYTQSP
jgi:hypothetical protein